MVKKSFLLFFTLMCLLVSSYSVALAESLSVHPGDTMPFKDMYCGERVCFEMSGKHLILTDENESQEFLSFYPNDENSDAVYIFYRFSPENTGDKFYIVVATDNQQNEGFWVIGKKDGNWVKFLTIDSFEPAGYTAQDWHWMFATKINDEDGTFMVKDRHEDAQIHDLVDDAVFLVSWDAGGFKIERTF